VRYALALCLLLAVAGGLCDGGPGLLVDTKPDPVSRPVESGVGWVSLVQMLGAVAVVGAAVKWLLPRWLSARRKARAPAARRRLRVVESLPFDGGSFQILYVDDRSFLIGVGVKGPVLLAELGGTAEVSSSRFQTLVEEAEATRGEARLTEKFSEAAARLDKLFTSGQ
jgi:flagellar biogenesis protein FliO